MSDTQTKEEQKQAGEETLLTDLQSKFTKAETAHREVRVGGFSWDDRERLFFGKYKHPSEKTKSVLSTGELATIAIDGSCRVMAQLPTGRFYNYNGNKGANMLINLLFEHYVMPNAVTGGNLLLKHRMANLYARVFPAIPVFIDWVVKDQYIGPDMIVIHPRRFFPQPGKNAIEDMDYCFFETEVSKDWLKSRDKDVWINIDEVVASDTEGTGSSEETRSVTERGKTKTGITIVHYFTSKGDWVIYAKNAKKIILNEKEWFTCIPIAVKQQYPVMDSIWAYNDFDRGEGTQKSIDSAVRMFLDGLAMTIRPPKRVDSNKAVVSSIVTQPDATWFGEAGSVEIQNVNPQGLNMVQGMWSMLKGNLLSMGASQDTSVSVSVDAGMGKTPEAIKAQGNKQGARDAWDSFMQERFIERVYTIMADMIAKQGVKPFAFQLLGTSIDKIKEQYPDSDFDNLIGTNSETGEVTIDNEKLSGKYRYKIDEGSTSLKKDDTGDKIMGLIELYTKSPEIKEDLARSGQKVDFGEAFKRLFIDQGIQDWEKIIVKSDNPESIAGIGADGATVNPPVPQSDPNTPPQDPSVQPDRQAQILQQIMAPQQTNPMIAQ